MKALTIIGLLLLALGSRAEAAPEPLHVYVFIAEECPISIYMARPLREAMSQYEGKARFYAVFPNQKSTAETAQRFLDDYQLPGVEIILDTDHSWTQKLGASVTPEVVITNSGAENILYRGRISNAYAAPGKMRHSRRTNDLANMLGRISEGKKVTPPWPHAVGCFITMKKEG